MKKKREKTYYPTYWQAVDHTTYRRKVPGGWIVWSSIEEGVGECMCFVPDLNHEWLLVEPSSVEPKPS